MPTTSLLEFLDPAPPETPQHKTIQTTRLAKFLVVLSIVESIELIVAGFFQMLPDWKVTIGPLPSPWFLIPINILWLVLSIIAYRSINKLREECRKAKAKIPPPVA